MNGDRKEVATIVLSMVTTCAIGAAVLGGVYLLTSAQTQSQRKADERREVAALLALGPGASVLEVSQFLAPARRAVIYRIAPMGGEERPLELTFDLDGAPLRAAAASQATSREAGTRRSAPPEKLQPLGRMFVARRGGVPAGFVVEGTTQGYKNRVRFLVGLDPRFEIAGVRVVEHEEDPGLGAEIATPEYSGQFVGRPANDASLAVTRDPMPEDWRAALSELRRMPAEAWRAKHRDLVARQGGKPIYAVTGATISSRALAEGVRVTVERFRTRWQRIAPYVDRTATQARPAPAGGGRLAAAAGTGGAR